MAFPESPYMSPCTTMDLWLESLNDNPFGLWFQMLFFRAFLVIIFIAVGRNNTHMPLTLFLYLPQFLRGSFIKASSHITFQQGTIREWTNSHTPCNQFIAWRSGLSYTMLIFRSSDIEIWVAYRKKRTTDHYSTIPNNRAVTFIYFGIFWNNFIK